MSDPCDLMIRGGRLALGDALVPGDIAVRGGRITALGELTGASAVREIDASGRLVLPGGVDPHAHVEQMSGMGLMNADTFETATRSAALGGTTSVISFAAQAKGQRLRDTVAEYAARAQRGAMIDHAFHIIISDPTVEGLEEDLADLIRSGHRSIKLFTTYNIQLSDREILRVMQVARAEGALVCIHAENDGLIGLTRDALIANGRTAPPWHAVSHPRMAEIEAVERMCRFAEFTGAPVMLFHISTAEGVAAVRAARGRGAPVWAETCPHYLLMTAEVLEAEGIDGAKWMCSPPQRREADQEALWHGLALGDLSLVSSDHAPYRFDKTGKLSAGAEAGFHQIANGLPGLEPRLPLMFDAMVSQGRGSVADFVRMTSSEPARIYGLPGKGAIAPGMDADLVLWEPDRQVTYGENDLHDNVGYNPWAGRTVTGWPETVILRGEVIAEKGGCSATPGQGKWLKRESLGVRGAAPAAEARLEKEAP